MTKRKRERGRQASVSSRGVENLLRSRDAPQKSKQILLKALTYLHNICSGNMRDKDKVYKQNITT